MRAASRRPRHDEKGQGVLEVVVALGVLSVVLIPLASVFYWGATNAAFNREHGDAIAIANGFLGKANAITYANLGFYESQFGTPPLTIAGYNGQPAVDLGTSPTAGVSEQVPVTSTPQQVGAVVFSERTYVVWVDGSGANSYAYKQVYSVVSWFEGGNKVQVTQSILVYPGGLGKYTGPQNNTPSGTASTPDNVAGLTATVPSDANGGETQVNLAWTAPQDPTGFYAAVWAPDPGGQLHLATPNTGGTSGAWAPTGSSTGGSIVGTATSFTVTGLAPSTTYWFEIVAFSSDGVQWAISQTWVTATTLTPPPQPCTLNTLAVSQSGQSSGQATVAQSNGHLIQPITMTVTYSGTCTSGADGVTVAATSTGADPGSPYTLSWGATQYSYSLCPATGFTTGTHTYTVSHNGTATSLTAQVSFAQDKKTAPAC
jgi:hypothetical protein